MDWPACASGSPSRRPAIAPGCVQPLGHGLSPDQRSRSAAAALADAGWLARTAQRLRQEAGELDRLLRFARFTILGGTPLFRLAQRDDTDAVFRQLCQAGILTRPFQARPDWLRFAIPHAPGGLGAAAGRSSV